MKNVYKFKTTINCNGCIAKVTPFLNESKGISHWEVNIADSNKILTIISSGITEQEINTLLLKAGFKSERIST